MINAALGLKFVAHFLRKNICRSVTLLEEYLDSTDEQCWRTGAARGSRQPFYKGSHICQLFRVWCWCPEGIASGMDVSRVSVQPSLTRQVHGNRDERKADYLEAGWLPIYWKCKFPCLLFLLSMKGRISSLLSRWEHAIDSSCILIHLLCR